MMDMRHNKHNNNSSIRYKTNKFLVVILLCKKHHPSKDVGVETDETGMMGPETASPLSNNNRISKKATTRN